MIRFCFRTLRKAAEWSICVWEGSEMGRKAERQGDC